MVSEVVLRCDGEPWFYVGTTGAGEVIWGEKANAARFSGDLADAVSAIKAAYSDNLEVVVEEP